MDLLSPWVFVLCVLAAARATRFVVYDSLMGSHLESGTAWSKRLDGWAFTPQGQDRNWLLAKVATLLSCPWCAGVYCSVAAVCLAAWVWPWDLGPQRWLVALAVCMGQALLNVAAHKYLD